MEAGARLFPSFRECSGEMPDEGGELAGLTFTSRELKLNQRRRDQATVLYGCMLSGV